MWRCWFERLPTDKPRRGKRSSKSWGLSFGPWFEGMVSTTIRHMMFTRKPGFISLSMWGAFKSLTKRERGWQAPPAVFVSKL
jgi:hypothetical protein